MTRREHSLSGNAVSSSGSAADPHYHEIRKMVEDNVSLAEIAKRLNLSEGIVSGKLRRFNMKLRGRENRKGRNLEWYGPALEMRSSGLKYGEIAEALGIPKTKVEGLFYRINQGLMRDPRGEK